MSLADFWWSSGIEGQAGGDPGDPIGNSLRFRASNDSTGPYLHKSGWATGGNVWTMSCWMKGWQANWTSTTQKNLVLFSWHAGGSTNTDEIFVFGNYPAVGNNEIYYLFEGSNNGYGVSNSEYNDPSAWYHVVWVSHSTSDVRVYINNEQVNNWRTIGTVSSQPYINKNYDCTIGGRAGPNTPSGASYASDGYLAQFYFVDGQALQPTSFGRTNDNGVWVPKNYTGSYGTNGFLLDFSDPSNLGADRSGNGNNFTANGFDVSSVGVWSNYLFTSTTPLNINSTETNIGASANSQRKNGFDGNTTYWPISTSSSDNWFIFRPNTPLTGVSSIQFTAPSNAFTINVNGQVTGQTVTPSNGSTPVNVTLPADFDGTLENIAFSNTTSASGQNCFSSLIINGVTLVDSAGLTYDLMQDSPTQNWNVINSASTAQQTAQNANLWSRAENGTWGSPQYPQQFGITKFTPDQDVYFECSTQYAVNNTWNSWATGFIVSNYLPDKDKWQTDKTYQAGYGFCADLASNNYNNNQSQSAGSSQDITTDGNSWAGNQVCGVRIRNNQITITRNGVATNVTDMTLQQGAAQGDGYYYLTCYNYYGPSDPNGYTHWNFGQRPWVCNPDDVNINSNALQSQNMPEVPILKGSDHFRAITGPGSGNDGGTAGQRGGNWTQQFYWSAPGAPDFDSTLPNPNTGYTSDRTFDGNLSTMSTGGTGGTTLIFRPDTPMTVNSSLRIYMKNEGTVAQSFWVNSAQVIGPTSYSSATWVDLGPQVTFPLTLTNLGFKGETAGSNLVSGGYIAAIEVDGEILVDYSILASAQAAFPSGLWWIKSRTNSNRHQLVTSIDGSSVALRTDGAGQQAYAAPTGTAIAWCWNAPDEFTPTVTGGLQNGQGYRNVEAGFSMVKATGTNAVGTYNHGLNKTPEFIISLKYSNANIGVFNAPFMGAVTNMVLQLDQGNAVFTRGSNTYDTVSDPTSVGVGSFAEIASTGDYMYFNWHSVPGYSHIGTFYGTGQSDGPFVYTGFRPAFVIMKLANNVGSGTSWSIFDTTVNPDNPATKRLAPNTNDAESNSTSRAIEFYSNGFKMRGSSILTNGSGDLIYAAFAEHPFCGSNTVPCNAR